MRTFTVHWNDLKRCLPLGNDLAGQAMRRDLFERIDGPDGKGILQQAKVIRAIYRSLPTITGIPDTRPFLTRGFHTTVGAIAPVARIGTDNLDRNQFRSFMTYIYYYVKVWELLLQNDAQVKGHVTLPEFEAALASLQKWGFKEAALWDRDPTAAFDRLSGGNSVLPVEEFIDRCLNSALPDLCRDGEENEREMAISKLSKTFPHLLDQNPTKKFGGLTFIGSALPLPPPGQKRPPPQPVSEALIKPHTFNRWATQYTVDYENPSRLPSPAPSAPGSRPQSRGELSKAQSTPALRRAESISAGKQTLTGLDREAIRKKLEAHVEMNNTSHLRKLLKVAGGMAVEKQACSPTRQRRPTFAANSMAMAY